MSILSAGAILLLLAGPYAAQAQEETKTRAEAKKSAVGVASAIDLDEIPIVTGLRAKGTVIRGRCPCISGRKVCFRAKWVCRFFDNPPIVIGDEPIVLPDPVPSCHLDIEGVDLGPCQS